MKGLDQISKATQLSQKLEKSLGLHFSVSEMLKAGEYNVNRYNGANMINEIARSIQNQKLYMSPSISMFEGMKESMAFQSKFTVPQNIFDSITSISNKYEQLFSGIREIIESGNVKHSRIAQMHNLHAALSGISAQIVAIAVQQRDWSIIEDFEEVSGQTSQFTETLSMDVTEEQEKHFQILLSSVLSLFKKHKNLGVSLLLILDIFLRFAGVHQYYDFLKEKPELATKTNVNQLEIKQDSVLHFITLINRQLIEAKEYRITNRICEVKLKPKSKSLTIGKLPKELEIIVMQVSHKWVYVSYFDPIDNLPQTGWVLKKYLNKP